MMSSDMHRHPRPVVDTRSRIMTVKTYFLPKLSSADTIPDSLVALAARLAAGSVFWRSGQTKIEGLHIKDSTFFLFREEYMVPLLPPDLAATVATVSENLLSVFLIVGFASRLSAAWLLCMTAVIQLVYPSGWPEHILWASALVTILVRGPGLISLDHFLFRRVPVPLPA
jgi:putative oxidoreductase